MADEQREAPTYPPKSDLPDIQLEITDSPAERNYHRVPNNIPETTGASAEVLTVSKTPKDILPVMLEFDEASEMAGEQCEALSTPPQITDASGEEKVYGLPETPVSMPDEDNSSPKIEVGQNHAARTNTFHFLAGNNILLCSSGSVALRYRNYPESVAVASQPLYRGMSIRFHVDIISDECLGALAVGAVSLLPTRTPPPETALDLTIPCWVVTEDLLYSDGNYHWNDMACFLKEIKENSVLTLHFRNNSDLVLEMDSAYRCDIATIPPKYNSIHPFIDLCGKVVQVSILHPDVIVGSTSSDLPMIKKQEESPEEHLLVVGPDSKTDPKGHSRGVSYLYHNTTGDRVVNDDFMPSFGNPDGDDNYNSSIAGCDTRSDDVDQSDNSGDKNNGTYNSSNPTDDNDPLVEVHEFVYVQEFDPSSATAKPVGSDNPLSEDPSSRVSMTDPLSFNVDFDSVDKIEETCDTNIHSNVYAEANELGASSHGNDGSSTCDESDDNVSMNALFLETSNEEQSLSSDDSTTTRRDDYDDDISNANARYLNGIIKLIPADHHDGVFVADTNVNCVVMNFALNFWNRVFPAHSDLRNVVIGGTTHCFCHDCDPGADERLSGWVRIERPRPQEPLSNQPHRMFWPVFLEMITSAPEVNDDNYLDMRRPHLVCRPVSVPPYMETFFDAEEGTPRVAAVSLEIDVSGQGPQDDRLLAYWIYLQSHAAAIKQEAESILARFNGLVGHAVDGINSVASSFTSE